jgi:hypothetical protein
VAAASPQSQLASDATKKEVLQLQSRYRSRVLQHQVGVADPMLACLLPPCVVLILRCCECALQLARLDIQQGQRKNTFLTVRTEPSFSFCS